MILTIDKTRREEKQTGGTNKYKVIALLFTIANAVKYVHFGWKNFVLKIEILISNNPGKKIQNLKYFQFTLIVEWGIFALIFLIIFTRLLFQATVDASGIGMLNQWRSIVGPISHDWSISDTFSYINWADYKKTKQMF